MDRMRRWTWDGRVAAAFVVGVAASALAQDVTAPAPRPCRFARTPAAASPAAAPAATPQRIFSVLDSSGRPAPSTAGRPPSTTNPARALLDRVSLYLSSVQTLVGNFVQIGPDGRQTEGTSTSRSRARCASNTIRRARSISSPTAPRSWCATASSTPQDSLSAVADAAALPAGRPDRSVARHRLSSACRPTTLSSP